MPYLSIRTNCTVDNPDLFLRQASSLCAQMLGKPESYVMVSLDAATPMLFAGSNEPAAYLELKSLGLPEADAKNYSRQLCNFIQAHTAISPQRIYIEFTCGSRELWGYNCGTFG